jgi:hypothetical protein
MSEPHNTVIDEIIRDLRPVRPVRIGAVMALLLAVEGVVLAAGIGWSGIRPDIRDRLHDPSFVGFVGILATAAIGSAWAALRLSVPGRDLSLRALVGLLLLPSLAAIAAVGLLPWGGRWADIRPIAWACWRCISFTAATAFIPWLFVVMTVSRLAPLRPARVGIFAGLSAFALGAMATELHCASREGYHLALGHYLPVAVMALMTGVFVAIVLRTRTGSRSRKGVEE